MKPLVEGVTDSFILQIRIKHSNILAQAHFLQTQTEPRLVSIASSSKAPVAHAFYQYYRPWELLPKDEDRVKRQVEEARGLISREIQQLDGTYSTSPHASSHMNSKEADLNAAEHSQESTDAIGKDPANKDIEDSKVNGTDPADVEMSENSRRSVEPSEPGKDAPDDGGEVVEGEEDTVIY